MPNAIRLALLSAILLCVATPQRAAAELLDLAPRRVAGDVYALSIDTTSESSLEAKRRSGKGAESVALHYEANVVVLEADAAGRPLRERHVDVVLRATRGDETSSLFREPVAFDVVRDADGAIEIHASDGRIERKLEKRIAALLESQFESSLAPALLAPGREVELGESWQLDADAARRFLRSQGVRAIELDGPATAALALREDGQALVVRYVIPVGWWKPAALPKNASAGRSEARFEGEVELVADPTLRPSRHVSKLTTEVSGVVTATGYAAPAPWKLATAATSDQRTRLVRKAVAANF